MAPETTREVLDALAGRPPQNGRELLAFVRRYGGTVWIPPLRAGNGPTWVEPRYLTKDGRSFVRVSLAPGGLERPPKGGWVVEDRVARLVTVKHNTHVTGWTFEFRSKAKAVAFASELRRRA
jgi:hypothetical protein